MTHAPSATGLDARYDQFLQTPVGDDRKGTSVTVLSMLARLGLDPWREASDLAALPKKSAWDRLDAVAARFTDVPSLIAGRADAVTRMIARLPGGQDHDNTRQATTPIPGIPGGRLYLIIAIAFLVVHLGVLWFGK